LLSSYVLSLREGIEAALVLGIVLGVLRQMQRPDLASSVWLGAGSAALLSLITAILLTVFGLELKDPAEAIFEISTMLLAAGILTWMIFWMSQRARHLKQELESGVQKASQTGKWSLFGLAFLAVLREGVELALFLTAAAISSGERQTILGAVFGLVSAGLLGWFLFASTIRLDMKRFFQITGILLIFFAAGLVAHSLQEFNEFGWIPAIIEHVWNLNPILNDQSTLGQVLATLFGYSGSPSLTEVLAYAIYVGVVILGLVWAGSKSVQIVKSGLKNQPHFRSKLP
jgi:high-affinity iron transporter